MRNGGLNIILFIVSVVFLAACNPFKVTDPADPRFDVTKFDFNDYETYEEMVHVMRTLFPIGTSKIDIEKVFIEYGGADKYEVIPDQYFGFGFHVDRELNLVSVLSKAKKIFQYGHKGSNPKFFWQVHIFYDEQDRIIQAVIVDHVVYREDK